MVKCSTIDSYHLIFFRPIVTGHNSCDDLRENVFIYFMTLSPFLVLVLREIKINFLMKFLHGFSSPLLIYRFFFIFYAFLPPPAPLLLNMIFPSTGCFFFASSFMCLFLCVYVCRYVCSPLMLH